MNTYYKIIDIIDGVPHFLYHGVNRSRKITMDKWLTANVKQVRDGSGGRYYDSGFHFFKDMRTAEKYLKRFTKPHKAIVKIQCKRTEQKPGSEAWLCDEIKFLS